MATSYKHRKSTQTLDFMDRTYDLQVISQTFTTSMKLQVGQETIKKNARKEIPWVTAGYKSNALPLHQATHDLVWIKMDLIKNIYIANIQGSHFLD